MSETIVVTDHTPHWADRFRQLHGQLAPHAADIAASIEHVGSTAVPGCAAKPIIDVDIVVADESVMPTLISRLTERGHRHEGDLGITGREAFRAPDHPIPLTRDAAGRAGYTEAKGGLVGELPEKAYGTAGRP
ncbi:GrpB family protein [Streptomyces venezuelae]|uniref:GrpB family protein n=1 Tax=Streptomyces venezuelae TaxID=54571 RepID=A0A5P2CAD6_STRVZ|nr:GrpB family protein [Streptomyces venezuelae]QES39745.1 GrpB family protein [Streptomyces venezuelae]